LQKLLLVLLLVLSNHAFLNAQCTAHAGADTSICLGASAQIGGLPAATGGGAPFSYSWSPATGLSCTNCPNPVVTPTGNTFYTLTVDGSSGCHDTDVIHVTIDPAPTANFTFATNNACSNLPIVFTNTSTGTGLSYSWNFGDPASGGSNTSTATNPTHIFQSFGTGTQNFTVTLVVTNAAGCSSSITHIVTVSSIPNPLLIDVNNSFKNCGGGNFDMQVFDGTATTAISNYTIQWGDGSPNFSSATFPGGGVNHQYSTSDVFTLNYILTGTNGCVDTSSYNIANITNPSIGSANPGSTTGCGPITLCFPLNNFSANHITTYYEVNFGDGSPIVTLPHPPPATICHTYSTTSCGQAGNQFVFRIKAVNLCDSSSASISPIRIYTSGQANFNPAAQNNCVNSTVTFINSTIAGFNSACSASSLYQWNFGNGQTLTTPLLTNPTTVYTLPGTYTVTLVVTNSCGSSTITRTVCIESAPTPNFTITPAVGCAPLSTSIVNTSDTLNSCALTKLWTVFFNGSPCTPTSGTFSFIGGTTQTSNNPQILFSTPGNYVVRLNLTNSCGSFILDKPVTVQAPPQVTLAPLPSICAGGSVNPSAVVLDCLEPTDTYSWTFPSGSPASSSLLSPGPVSFSTAGNITISFTATNACGPTTQTTNFVVKPLPPVLNPTVNSPLCVGNTANFTSSTVAGVNYSWSGPNSFSSTAQNPSLTNVSLLQSGTYSLFGTLNGCPGPVSTVVLNVNPIPVVTVTPPSGAICIGNSIQLVASGASSYTWSPATGLNTTTNDTVIASPTASQTYSIIGSNGICSGTTTVPITVNPLPIVSAGPDQVLCNQAIPITLTGTPVGGSWSGGGVSPAGSFTPSTNGVFTSIYSFTNANGCTNTDTIQLTVIAPTQAQAGLDSSTCLNTPAVVFSGTPVGGTWTGTNTSPGGSHSPITAGTFNLIYTFGSGTCLTRDTVQIEVFPLPIVDAGLPQSYCVTALNDTLMGSPLLGEWSGTGIIDSTGIFSPSVAGAGSHTIMYTIVDTNSCTNTDNVVLTVNPLPIVNAGLDQTLCNQPIPVNLSGTPVGGTWSGPNVTPTGVFTPSGNGVNSLVYSFTNVNGCSKTDTVLITVISPTQPNAGPDFATCINSPNTVLTATPVGGTWSGTNTTPAGIFDPTTEGNFNLVYSFGVGTCLLRDTLVVTVNPLPVVEAGLPASYCISAPSFVLSGTPAGGTWTGTGITNPLGNFSPATAGAGAHTLTYSFTDLNSCTNTDNVVITINALPVVNAGPNTTLCNLPIPVQLSASPVSGTWTGTTVSPTGLFTPTTVGSFTLTYTFTNGNGCVNSDTRIVNVVSPVVSNAGPDLVVCVDAANVTLAGTPVSGTWTGSFVTPAGIFNPTIAGTFPLVITNGVGNCLTRDTMLFTVNPLPIVSVGLDQVFCPNDSPVNFIGSPINGTWSGTGITNTTTGFFEPSIPAPGVYPEIYTFTSPITGCINRDTLLATVNSIPVANFTYNPITCIGTSELFTNTTVNGSTYEWDFGDLNSSLATSPNHAYATAGFFNIEMIASTPQGCKDTIVHSIEVRVPPFANFTLAPDSACGPVIVSFTDLSTGPSLSYNWNFGNGANSTLPNPGNQTYVASLVSDTFYIVTLNVTNFCGTSQHQDTVIAMPQPVALFGTDFGIGCTPLNLQFVNNSVGLPDSYLWDFGDGTFSTDTSATLQHVFYTGTEDTTYTILLTVQNECGTDTISHQVTVIPPQVNAFFNTDDPDGCVPHTVNFTQFTQGAIFSSWDFDDGNTSTVYNPTHTFTNPGTYTVRLFANGCGFDTAEVVITVFPSPLVSFDTNPDSVCINEIFAFTNTSPTLAGSHWDFGDGDTSILTSPTHIFQTSGTYQVTLTGTSLLNGCTASVTHPIVVSTNPIADFSLTPTSGCVPLTVSMTNLSSNSSFYAWDFGDGNTSTAFSPTHQFTTPGTYAITLYAENANGCTDTIFRTVTVHPFPAANFSVTSNDICSTPMISTFTNSSTGGTNYEWNFGDGQTSTLTNPVHTYNSPGNYNVSLIVTTIYGCKDTTDLLVSNFVGPTVNFTMPTDTICQFEELQFVATSTLASSLQWNFGDGNILTGNPVSYTYTQSGNFPVELIAFGAGGCSDTANSNVSIVIMPTPTADFSYENVQNSNLLSGLVEFTNLSSEATTYSWDFGNGNNSTETNPVEQYEQSGMFTIELIATSDYGCVDTSIQTLEVEFFYGLFIPNAMSPGHSDFGVANFIPKGVGMKNFELLIYDDWGNLIWSTNALDADGRPTEYWDGTFNGEPVQQDAYVWKATATFLNEKVWEGKEYPNGRLKRSGTITIIR
jgi:large repetitive protein